MKPQILVARAIFPDLLARLAETFEVESNQQDRIFNRDELARALSGKDGAFITGSERIDAIVLDANPQLKALCNMAVGYNNIDVDACTARGVLVTNTPDVLTETTADFGFALMMATARRMAESEHFLRRGEWKNWRYDMFVGPDVHGATLGILGMGRIGQAGRRVRDRAARVRRSRFEIGGHERCKEKGRGTGAALDRERNESAKNSTLTGVTHRLTWIDVASSRRDAGKQPRPNTAMTEHHQ